MDKAIETHKIPTYEECVEALKNHGSRMVSGANCLGKDTFAHKSVGNKKKFKEIEAEMSRMYYDSADVKNVKKASHNDNLFTDEERNGVIGGVGALYMISFLLKKVMNDTFGELLGESSPGAKKVYLHCIKHMELTADMMFAFTDRFSYNANESGMSEFGITLDVDKLCTDIDVLNIDNTIRAFSTRFMKKVKEQEALIKSKKRQ